MNDNFIVTFYVKLPGEDDRPWVAYKKQWTDLSLITLGMIEIARAKVDPEADWYFIVT